MKFIPLRLLWLFWIVTHNFKIKASYNICGRQRTSRMAAACFCKLVGTGVAVGTGRLIEAMTVVGVGVPGVLVEGLHAESRPARTSTEMPNNIVVIVVRCPPGKVA